MTRDENKCDHGFIVHAVKVNNDWRCKNCGELLDLTEATPIRIEEVDDETIKLEVIKDEG